VFELTVQMRQELLGAQATGVDPKDAGALLRQTLISYMKVTTARHSPLSQSLILPLIQGTNMPNGLSEVGFNSGDIEALVAGAMPQQRVIGNAPCTVTAADLRTLYQNAMRYW
jgi:alcohol dehydrogenase class IV